MSERKRQQIDLYIEILFKWNKKFSLISKRYIEADFFSEQVMDCIALGEVLAERNIENVVDLGSGAGLPGIVLSVVGLQKVNLVERNQKKIAFLRFVINSLALKGVEVFCDDIRNVHFGIISAIVSKAVGSIKLILELCAHNIKSDTRIYLLKSREQVSESSEVKGWLFDLNIIENKYKFGSVILELYNIRRNEES